MITPSFGLTATERVLPKLALDFTTASLDSRITFTRTTGASNPATYVNSGGYVTTTTNNQPRFDYDPVTLACKGLLIEESRTNFLTYSQDMNNAAYGRAAITVYGDNLVSPDGTQNAEKFSPQASSTEHYVDIPSVSFTSGTAYTFSMYIKAAGVAWIAITLPSAAFSAGNRVAWFDATNGVIGTKDAGVTASIVNAGNGWFRISATATASSTTAARAYFTVSNADNTRVFTGNNVSGMGTWGAQLEAGAFATSYIPTTATTLTRNADVATMTGTNFSDWFNASEGTFECTFDKIGVTSEASNVLWSIGNGSNTNNTIFVNAAYNGAYRTRLFGYNATTLDVDVYPTTTYSANTFVDTCFAYKANSYAGAVNAGAVATDTAGNVPSVVNMVLGANAASTGAYLNGHIEKLNYYQQRLTDAEVQAFSKG